LASAHSYKITLNNNKTEKEAIEYLIKDNPSFIEPDKDSRKNILNKLGLAKKFIRAFDLIQVQGHTNLENEFVIDKDSEIILIEIKSTKKKLKNNPYGFFFGATENEFSIAEQLGDNYKFCFVCLHPETKSYVLLSNNELNEIITNKRIQYQINIKTKQD